MKTIEQQRLDFLNETVKYYSEDTSRRATNDEGFCQYLVKETGNKCAIGRHIKPEDYTEELENKSVDNELVLNKLPEEIKELGKEYLVSVQLLHDCNWYWNEEGLSNQGKEYVARIITIWCS